MKCVNCGSEDLYCSGSVSFLLPLAARHGSVKIGGFKITQIDIKKAWDLNDDGTPKTTKGPVVCGECETRMIYTEGKLVRGPT